MITPPQSSPPPPPQSSMAMSSQYGPLPSNMQEYPPPPYGANRTTTYYWPQQYDQQQPQFVHRPQATYAQAVRHPQSLAQSQAAQMQSQQSGPAQPFQFAQPRLPPPLQQGISQPPAQQASFLRRLPADKHNEVLPSSHKNNHCRTHCQHSSKALHLLSQQPLTQRGLAREQ